jgi:hypothetical protein
MEQGRLRKNESSIPNVCIRQCLNPDDISNVSGRDDLGLFNADMNANTSSSSAVATHALLASRSILLFRSAIQIMDRLSDVAARALIWNP